MPGHYTARNLRRRYQSTSGDAITAVDIESLSVALGGIIAIVGGSGSGKTTLLNLLGLLEPCDSEPGLDTSLQFQLPGDSVAQEIAAGAQAKGRFPYDKVSYIFQQGYLLNQASLAVNLGLTRRAAGWKADDDALKGLLELAQLNEDDEQQVNKKLTDRAVSLSGGQQQRINIARALGREPSVIFADELTSSLDPMKAHDVMSVLRDWVWQGSSPTEHARASLHRTVFWVTHDYALACEFADAIIILNNGGLAEGCAEPIELTGLASRPTSNELMEWVKAGRVLMGANVEPVDIRLDAEQSEGNSQPPATRESQSISRMGAVLGNMKDGMLLSLMEAYPPKEHSSRVKTTSGFLSALSRLALGFSHWVRALQLAAVLALIMIVTYGQKEVITYFDAQLDDPALRHVIVQQNTLELERSVINEQSLGVLSASIAELDPRRALADDTGTGIQVEQVAFGRFTESADVYPQDIDRINPGFIPEATIGVFDADEPVYQSLDVTEFDSAGRACGSKGGATPRDLIPYGDELAVIVTRAYLEQFTAMYDADLCESPFVDIWDAGEPKTFRIAGIVNSAPADGFDTFDIMLQAEVWRTWVSLANRPVIDTFSRAAVYFNQLNHAGVIEQLKERSFAFDQEIIDKFERLIGTAAKLRNTFLVITWLTLGVAATVAAGLIWSYLAQNAQSIAVLRAHAAWSWPLLAAIPFQLLLTFAYGLLYLGIAVLIWNVIVMLPAVSNGLLYASGGSWIVGPITWAMLKPTLPWLVGSLLVMLLVGWVCLVLWRLTHRQLAHELRQAY